MNNVALSYDNEIGLLPSGTFYLDQCHTHVVIWVISYSFLLRVRAEEQ